MLPCKQKHAAKGLLLKLAACLQVIALMMLSLVSFLYLRLLQPCSDRADLIAKLVGELMSFGVFVCGIILIAGPSENDHFRCVVCRW